MIDKAIESQDILVDNNILRQELTSYFKGTTLQDVHLISDDEDNLKNARQQFNALLNENMTQKQIQDGLQSMADNHQLIHKSRLAQKHNMLGYFGYDAPPSEKLLQEIAINTFACIQFCRLQEKLDQLSVSQSQVKLNKETVISHLKDMLTPEDVQSAINKIEKSNSTEELTQNLAVIGLDNIDTESLQLIFAEWQFQRIYSDAEYKLKTQLQNNKGLVIQKISQLHSSTEVDNLVLAITTAKSRQETVAAMNNLGLIAAEANKGNQSLESQENIQALFNTAQFQQIKNGIQALQAPDTLLTKIANAENTQQIRLLISNQNNLGNIDFTGHETDESIINNAQAIEIQHLAAIKIISIAINNAETISADLNKLATAVNAVQIRQALHDQSSLGGVKFSDPGLNDKLSNQEAFHMQTAAIYRIFELSIKLNLLNDIENLTVIANASQQANMQQALIKIPRFEKFNLNYLDQETFEKIRVLAANKIGTLTIHKCCKTEDLNFLTKIANATTSTALVNELSNYVGLKNNNFSFGEEDCKQIQQLATNKAIIISLANTNILTNELKNLANAALSKDVRQALQDQPNFGNIHFADVSQDKQLTDDEAKAIRQIAIEKTFALAIAADLDNKHFHAAISQNSSIAQVQDYLKLLLKFGGNYSGIEINTIDIMQSSQINSLKVLLIAKHDNNNNKDILQVIDQYSLYPASAHSALMQLIQRFPHDVQEKLGNANNGLLYALLNARHKHELYAALRECGVNVTNTELSDNKLLHQCCKENNTLRLTPIMHNTLATILAPIIGLDNSESNEEAINKITKINSIILNKVVNQQDLTQGNHYEQFINDIIKVLEIKDTVEQQRLVHALLGSTVKDNIIIQWQRNQELYQQYIRSFNNNPRDYNKMLALHHLAQLEKTDVIEPDKLNLLLTEIIKRQPYNKFMQQLKHANGDLAQCLGTCNKWEIALSEANHKTIQKQIDRITLLTNDYQILLSRLNTQLSTKQQQLADFDQDNFIINSEIKELSKIKATEWLNPAIESIAREDAIRLYDKFTNLGEACKHTLDQLQAQSNELTILLYGIPSNKDLENVSEAQRAHIIRYRQQINDTLDQIKDMLLSYTSLYCKLYGNHHDKGLLAIMEDAKNSNLVPKKRDEVFSSHKDLDEYYRQHYDNQYEVATSCAQMHGNNNLQQQSTLIPSFENIGGLRQNEIRLHALKGVIDNASNTKIITDSAYTEECNKAAVKENKSAYPISLDIKKFPTYTTEAMAANNSQYAKELQKAKVKFIADMAVNLLMGMGNLPTPHNPIILTGNNKEQLGIMWTVLMELGKAHKKYKFDEKSIQVQSYYFNPSLEKNILGQYKNNSFYYQYCIDNDIKGIIYEKSGQIKEFYQHGFGPLNNESNVDRATKNQQITSLIDKFQNIYEKQNKVLDQIKQENANNDLAFNS